MTAKQLAGLCATWMAFSMAHAAERHADVKYSPPEGFAGHRWGAMRFIFERLPEEPLAVSAGWIHPQEKSVSFTCRPMPYRGPIMNGPVPACEYDATRNTLHRSHHGGGFYVLSEYAIDGQGFELGEGEDAVVLYPVVYQFHGCSSGDERQHNNPPVQDQSGADAIHIRGRAIGDCWDTTPNGPDVLFFDALVAQIEGTLCADPARRFATGYSSGAFMTHRVACDRGDSLRGVASIAGGVGGGECQGQVAALLIHDFNDDIVDISASVGARDTHIQRNVCSTVMPTTPVEPAPCQAYVDCAEGFPVVWCQTSEQGHSRQDQLAATAFWGFLSALPPS